MNAKECGVRGIIRIPHFQSEWIGGNYGGERAITCARIGVGGSTTA